MPQTFDIVIPHRNRAQALQRALASTHPGTYISTIIIIDDFSDDDKIPKSIDLQTVNGSMAIRMIRNSRRMGAQRSRIYGVMESQADWIIFLDCDDEFLDGMPDRLCSFIVGLPEDVNLVYGDHFYGEKQVSVRVLEGICYSDILKDLSLAPFSGLCARRSRIPVGALDLDLPAWQDDDFILEMSRTGKIIHVGEPIARLNKGSDRISNNRQAQYDGLQRLFLKWSAEIRCTHGRFAILLWKLRLLRLRALMLSDAAHCTLANTNAPTSRRIRAAMTSITGKIAAFLLYVVLRPFFSHIYI